MRPLRELHLFAGGGGGILGGILCGHTPVCAVEIEPYRRKSLLQRQRDGFLPKFPIWDDIRTFDGRPWKGRADIVSGGFPCQGISISGKGLGMDDPRSGLWKEMARVVREVGPKYVLVENSPALTFRGLGTVLGDLAEMGYDAQWGVFHSDDTGAWHQRSRLFLLAFNANQVGIQRQRECHYACQARPWREVSEEHLRKILEEPTTNQGSNKPLLSGDEYGMANWVDQVESIGDGQVPEVVRIAWNTLINNLCHAGPKKN